MPKIIENVRQMVIDYSKKKLLADGYHSLTIRNVADECGIASGTVYNYFPSKDELVAEIMLEDWIAEMKQAAAACRRARSCTTGFGNVFNAIRSFTDIYRDIFAEYGPVSTGNTKYHEFLIQQIERVIRPLIERFGTEAQPDPSRFIAETLLHYGLDPRADYNFISPFLERLV